MVLSETICRPRSDNPHDHELVSMVCSECGGSLGERCLVCDAWFPSSPEEEWCECGDDCFELLRQHKRGK